MRTKPIQVELTIDEIIAISGAVLIAKQVMFGYDLDKSALEIINEKKTDLNTVSVKLGNVLRTIQLGEIGI